MAISGAPWAEPARWAAGDLLMLPDDGWCYELVRGRLVRMAPTTWGHGRITNRLQRALDRYVETHNLGEIVPAETGFNLTMPGERDDTVLAADIAFVRADRLPQPDTDTFAALAPDLVVEIASKGQHRPGMDAKARLWLERGARLVWVVWPRRRTVDVWQTEEYEAARDPDQRRLPRRRRCAARLQPSDCRHLRVIAPVSRHLPSNHTHGRIEP